MYLDSRYSVLISQCVVAYGVCAFIVYLSSSSILYAGFRFCYLCVLWQYFVLPVWVTAWQTVMAGYTAASRLQALRDYPPLSAAQGSAILGGSLHTSLRHRQYRQHLRSASSNQLVVPRHRRTQFGRRAFSVAGPMAWNALPDNIRDTALSTCSFRRYLKTLLFSFYQRTSALEAFSALEVLSRNALYKSTIHIDIDIPRSFLYYADSV